MRDSEDELYFLSREIRVSGGLGELMSAEKVVSAALAGEVRSLVNQPVVSPLANETVCVTFARPKTAALFFDRVLGLPGLITAPPPSILVFGSTGEEMAFHIASAVAEVVAQHDGRPINQHLIPGIYLRRLAEHLHDKWSVAVRPIYDSAVALDEEYKPGQREVLVAAIANLGVVDEQNLTWEQVLEFRSDAESRRHYRRLIHWADKELVGKSVAFVEDEISIRVDACEHAITKHGVQTRIGAVESMLDPLFLGGAAAVMAPFALGGSVSVAAIAGTILFASKLAINMSRRLVDLSDVKAGPNSEIAYVYEIAKTASTQNPIEDATADE